MALHKAPFDPPPTPPVFCGFSHYLRTLSFEKRLGGPRELLLMAAPFGLHGFQVTASVKGELKGHSPFLKCFRSPTVMLRTLSHSPELATWPCLAPRLWEMWVSHGFSLSNKCLCHTVYLKNVLSLTFLREEYRSNSKFQPRLYHSPPENTIFVNCKLS